MFDAPEAAETANSFSTAIGDFLEYHISSKQASLQTGMNKYIQMTSLHPTLKKGEFYLLWSMSKNL